jgi:hypothetical protein
MFLLKRGGAKAGAGGAAQRKAAHRFEPQRALPVLVSPKSE